MVFHTRISNFFYGDYSKLKIFLIMTDNKVLRTQYITEKELRNKTEKRGKELHLFMLVVICSKSGNLELHKNKFFLI